MKKQSNKEQRLNDMYSTCYSLNDAIDNFCYLNDGKIRNSTIATHYTNHTLGTLLKKYDPIAYRIAISEI
jgi:hypothetical protein